MSDKASLLSQQVSDKYPDGCKYATGQCVAINAVPALSLYDQLIEYPTDHQADRQKISEDSVEYHSCRGLIYCRPKLTSCSPAYFFYARKIGIIFYNLERYGCFESLSFIGVVFLLFRVDREGSYAGSRLRNVSSFAYLDGTNTLRHLPGLETRYMTSKPPGHWLFLFVFLCVSLRSHSQVTCTPVFINEYAGQGWGTLQPHAMKALADGTVLIAGRATASLSNQYDGYISRHNADGTPMW